MVATNRINMPEVAEAVLAEGGADLVSLARPFLADPEWVRKAAESRADEINTCIACNQACLDHTFVNRRATCLVNPRACHETELVLGPTRTVRRVAVVGAGPAGLAAATTLADRGHEVELFEARDHVGGQFDIAMRIPGKEEFAETIRYYTRRLDLTGVKVHLGRAVEADELVAAGFDEVVVATGVEPRVPAIPGVDHPMVMTYAELVRGERTAGARVAVVGAGGIGVDVSEYLTTEHSAALDLGAWKAEWGVGDPATTRGGVTAPQARAEPAARRPAAAQAHVDREGARQDLRVGAPSGAAGQGCRARDWGACRTTGSTTTACTSPSRSVTTGPPSGGPTPWTPSCCVPVRSRCGPSATSCARAA